MTKRARFGIERYPVVLFDFDGTLADTGPAVMRTVRRTLEEKGFGPVREEDLRKILGPPLPAGFCMAFGLSPEDAIACTEAYRARFAREMGPGDCPPFPGVPGMLAALKREGRAIAVATSRLQASAEQMLADAGIRDYFDAVAGRDETEGRATKGDSIRYALELLGGALPQDAVMVGDRFHDVDGAREVGCAVIGVYTGAAAEGEFDRADAACHGIAEVATLLGV